MDGGNSVHAFYEAIDRMKPQEHRFPDELCNLCGDVATKHTPSDNPLCEECFSAGNRERGHAPTQEELKDLFRDPDEHDIKTPKGKK